MLDSELQALNVSMYQGCSSRVRMDPGICNMNHNNKSAAFFIMLIWLAINSCLSAQTDSKQVNWPAFRGLNASGIAEGTALPTDWDAASSKNILWKTPIPGDGKIYIPAEDGDVYVIKAGPKYELLAKNSMGEVCMASLAISEGVLYIRTQAPLFAVSKKWEQPPLSWNLLNSKP
jgi:hypothetical protein